MKTFLGISRIFVLMSFLLHMIGAPAMALDANELPIGGQITNGQGDISSSGNQMTVNQYTDRMVADWSTFNIGSDASVQFIQPGSSSVALNRIFDSSPSQIFGKLSANGQVFLLNSAGIIFGPSAQVNVGALVASSLNMTDENFMAGKYIFERGTQAGPIVNQGYIHTADGMYAALISPIVRNEGTIESPLGSVLMAAGDKVTLDFAGDGLINYTVDEGAVDALVENKNLIKADGGLIVMTAKAADELTTAVVNNEGIVEAKGISEKGGRIILDAGENGQTTISGTLDVSSEAGNGGKIVATADRVLVTETAELLARGATGGGEIYVGGGWQGSDPDIYNATGVVVLEGALLDASVTDNGNGGTIVAWSDVSNLDSVTRVYGAFLANGGVNGGDGGRIETSGHWLDTIGVTGSASSYSGQAGLWLFDPYNVTISTSTSSSGSWSGTDPDIWTASASGSTILNSDINSKLNNGTSVTITTGTSGSEDGNITVASSISKTSGVDATLTLKAANNITINSSVSISSTSNKLNTILWADCDGSGSGQITLNNSSSITTNGGHLWLGGGSGSTTWNSLTVGDGYAVGNSTDSNGVLLTGTTINTNGGNIAIYGKGRNGATVGSEGTNNGIQFSSSSGVTINSGTGTIYLHGEGQGGSAKGLEIGIMFNGSGHSLTSAATNTDAITLYGKGGSTGTGNSNGLQFQTGTITATGTNGNIVLEGIEGNTSSTWWGAIQINNSTAFSTTNSGNITVMADSIDIGSNARFSGAGTLTVKPVSDNRAINITSSTSDDGTLHLTTTNFSTNFVNGFSGIIIGSSTAGAFAIGNATTFQDSTTLLTKSTIAINGAITANENLTLSSAGAITQSSAVSVTGTTDITAGAANNITLTNSSNNFTGGVRIASGKDVSLTDTNALILGNANGASTVSGNLTTTSGGAITQSGAYSITGTTSITAGANDVTLTNTSNDFGGTVTVVSAKNLSLLDSNAMSLGAITSTGTVDAATSTGDLTLTGAINTTNATASAVKLNAGKDTAAGTATGGNIIISGGTVTVGAGGQGNLYSGSISGSTGLTGYIGSGSGRFRYGSDETTTSYSAALTAGNNAIYREQLAYAVQANNVTQTYSGTSYSGGGGVVENVSFVNGDTKAMAVSGTVTYSGTSQGASAPGTYTITPGGYTSLLGYAISYLNGTLTIDTPTNAGGKETSLNDAVASVYSNISSIYSIQQIVNGTQDVNSALGNGQSEVQMTGVHNMGPCAGSGSVDGAYSSRLIIDRTQQPF